MDDFLKNYPKTRKPEDDDFINFYLRKRMALGQEIPEEYQSAVRDYKTNVKESYRQKALEKVYKDTKKREEEFERFKINQKIEAQKTDRRNQINYKSSDDYKIEGLQARTDDARFRASNAPERNPSIAKSEMPSMYKHDEKASYNVNPRAIQAYNGYREQIKQEHFLYHGQTFKEMAEKRKAFEEAGYDEVSITNGMVKESIYDLDTKLANIERNLKEGKENIFYNMKESSLRKQVETMLANEAVREMYGYNNQLETIQKWMAEHPELDPDWMKHDLNKVERFVYGATGGITDMGTLIVQSGLAGIDDALMYAMAGGVAGAMYGGGIASPWTATSGALLGAQFGLRKGAFEHMAMIEAGHAYLEYIEQGIDPEIASQYATGVGVINGLIELALVSGIIGVGGAGANLLKKAINGAYAHTGRGLVGVLTRAGVNVGKLKAKHKILDFTTDYVANLTGNVFEEIAQEAVTIAGSEFSARKHEKETGQKIATASAKENRARLIETGKQSLVTMSMFPLGTAMGTRAFNYAGTKIQKSQYENSQEFKNFTETIENEEHLKFYEDMANKKDALPSREEYETIKINMRALESIKGAYKLTNGQQEKVNELLAHMKAISNRYQYQAKEENQAITYAFEDFDDLEEELTTTTKVGDYDATELGIPIKTLETFSRAKKDGYIPEIRELIFQYERNGYLAGIDVNNENMEERKILTIAQALKAKNRKMELTDAYAYARAVIKMEQALKKAKILNSQFNKEQAEEQIDLENNPVLSEEIDDVNTEGQGEQENAPDTEQQAETDIQEEETEETVETEVVEEEIEQKTFEEVKEKKNAPKNIVSTPVDDMNVDTKRFQFRFDVRQDTGTTKELSGTKGWNEKYAGIITLWQDEAGDLWVVNGHHRVALAKQYGIKELNAQILSYEDYTEEEARAEGAMINIAEGNASAVDIARFMRDTGMTEEVLVSENIPPKKLRDGVALSKLHDAIFQAVATKKFNQNMAIVISNGLENKDLQYEVYKTVDTLREDKGKTITQSGLAELINQVKSSAQDTKEQISLLGMQSFTETSRYEKSQLVDATRTQLRKAKRVFKTASEEQNKERLERIGNVIDVEANAQMASEAELAEMFLDASVYRPGSELSEAFNELAQKYKEASSNEKAKLKKEAYNTLIQMIEEGNIKTEKDVLQNAFQIKEPLAVKGDEIQNNDITDVIEKAKNNPVFNGVEIVYNASKKLVKGSELNDNSKGYARQNPDKQFQITGEYNYEGNGRGQVLLYEGATRDTVLEELVHHIQFGLEEIDPALYSAMVDWIANAERMAENIGIEVPNSFELFAQALVFSEMGYATENQQLADLIALPDALVENFRDVMGKEFYDAVKGREYSKLAKEEKILDVEKGKKSGMALHGTRYSTEHSANNSPLLDNYKYRENEKNYTQINSEAQWKIVSNRHNERTSIQTYLGTKTGMFSERIYIDVHTVAEGIKGGILKNSKESLVYSQKYNKVSSEITNGVFDEYDPYNKMTIAVDAYGDAFFTQGEAIYDALVDAGYTQIPVEIDYYDGSERIEGAFYPDKVVEASNKVIPAPEVVFDFNQRFSTELGKQESFDIFVSEGKGQQTLFQMKPIEQHSYIMHGFYSKLIRLIDSKFQGRRFKASDLLALIEKPENGIKDDEIRFSGIREYLTERIMDNGYVYMDDIKNEDETIKILGLKNFLKQNYPNIKVYRKGYFSKMKAKDYDFTGEINIKDNSDTLSIYDGTKYVTEVSKHRYYSKLENTLSYLSRAYSPGERRFLTRGIVLMKNMTNHPLGILGEIFEANEKYKNGSMETNEKTVEFLDTKLLRYFDDGIKLKSQRFTVLSELKSLERLIGEATGEYTQLSSWYLQENKERLLKIDKKTSSLAMRLDVFSQTDFEKSYQKLQSEHWRENLGELLHADFGRFEVLKGNDSQNYYNKQVNKRPLEYVFETYDWLNRFNNRNDGIAYPQPVLDEAKELENNFHQIILEMASYIFQKGSNSPGLVNSILDYTFIEGRTFNEFLETKPEFFVDAFKNLNDMIDTGETKEDKVYKTLGYEAYGKPRYEQWAYDLGDNYREFLFTLPKAFKFNTNHWDRDDIIAHARTKDIKIEGKKYLLIDEVQSDLHGSQVARKRNFEKKAISGIRASNYVAEFFGGYGKLDTGVPLSDNNNYVPMDVARDIVSRFFDDFTGYRETVSVEGINGESNEYSSRQAPIVRINKERYTYFQRLLKETLGATDEQILKFMTEKLMLEKRGNDVSLGEATTKINITKRGYEKQHIVDVYKNYTDHYSYYLYDVLRDFMIENDMYSSEKYELLMNRAEELYDEMGMEALEELREVALSVADVTSPLPVAPYKSAWQEMVIKQLVNLAVESEYDGLAWSTGREQANRYKINKHVNEVRLSHLFLSSDTFDVKGYYISGLELRLLTDNGDVTFTYETRDGKFYREGKSLDDYVGKDYADRIREEIEKKKKLFSEYAKVQSDEFDNLQNQDDSTFQIDKLKSSFNNSLTNTELFTLTDQFSDFYEDTTFTEEEIDALKRGIFARPNILPAVHIVANAERLGFDIESIRIAKEKYDETGFLTDLATSLIRDIGSEKTIAFIEAYKKKDPKFEKYLDELEKLGSLGKVREVGIALMYRVYVDEGKAIRKRKDELENILYAPFSIPEFMANEKGKSTIYDEIMVQNFNKLNKSNKWNGKYDFVKIADVSPGQEEHVAIQEVYDGFRPEILNEEEVGDYFVHRFELTPKSYDRIKKYGQSMYQAKEVKGEGQGDTGELSFMETVANMDGISQEFKDLINSKKWTYEVKHNSETMIEALYILNEEGEEAVMDWILGNQPGTTVMFMAGQLLISKMSQNHETMDRSLLLLERMSQKANNMGQGIQILSAMGRLSPATLVRRLEKTIEDTYTPKEEIDLRTKSQKVRDIIDKINANALTELSIGNWLNKIIKMQPEEMLSRRVLATLSEKTPEDNPIKMMVDTLFKLAKEEVPLEQKAVTKDPLEFIVEAIKNRDRYREVWKLAKRQLEENILKDNEEALAKLQPFFEFTLDKTFPQSRLRQTVKQELKTLEINIADIVKQHYTQQNSVKKSLTEELIKRAGLEDVEAMLLEDYIYKEMDRLTREEKERQLKRIFADKKPKKESPTIDQRIIELSNLGAFTHRQYKHLIAEKLGMQFADEDTINTIHTMAQNIQTMEDGRAKDVEVAKMIDIMSAQIEPSMWQKVDLFQTMMQLLNPKTLIRNIVGNAGFSLAEYISDQVAVPLDKFASMITKTDRTKFFTPGQKASTQWKGFKKGISLGFEDAVKGIDTTSLDTQYDLPKSRVFREGILADLELLLNVGLRVTDRGSYMQAFEDELRELMLMEGVSKPTPEMLEYAHHKGLYRTFQDANLISDMAVKTKQLLNHIGKDGFGVGSFLLKYPKTPANLIARGVDYTFVNAGIQVFKMIQQARKGELTLYSKKAMVEGIARGVTGTVAVGLGYVLARAGVISGTPDDEEPWRISSFRRTLGLRDYSINIDALIRWVSSGLKESQIEPQPGDTYMTYDWFQPSAISIAMGADMYRQEQLKDVVSTGLGAVASGANTLIQQPLLQGITDVLSARSLEEGVMNFSEGILSSFTPTLFSQMAYLIDPTVRNPRDMESNLKTALNLSIKKIPFLSQTLPAYYDQFGNKSEYDFGSSFFEGLEDTFATRFFNSFFAPAIMGEFNPTVEEEKVLNLIRNTGESRHVPKYLDKKWTVQTWQNQEKTPVEVVLTPDEYEELSKWAGEQAKIRYREEIERYGLGTLDDYEQVDILNDILNDVRQGVRDKIIEMRGYEPY